MPAARRHNIMLACNYSISFSFYGGGNIYNMTDRRPQCKKEEELNLKIKNYRPEEVPLRYFLNNSSKTLRWYCYGIFISHNRDTGDFGHNL